MKHLFALTIFCAIVLGLFCINANAYQMRNGKPLFITHFHINPQYVERISRFRSLVGHAYLPCKAGCQGDCFNDPNYYEYRNCESDKHYYDLTETGYDILPPIYAPCDGTINYVRLEQQDNPKMGYQIGINPAGDASGYMVALFHVNQNGLKPGDKVTAGEQLGNHATSETMSDIAIFTPDNTTDSAFNYMTDDVLQKFGLTTAELYEMIISETDRNKYPSYCQNPYDPLPHPNPDPISDWYYVPAY